MTAPKMTREEAQAAALLIHPEAEALEVPYAPRQCRYGIAWDDGKDYGLAGDGPRFHGTGASWEEALENAR